MAILLILLILAIIFLWIQAIDRKTDARELHDSVYKRGTLPDRTVSVPPIEKRGDIPLQSTPPVTDEQPEPLSVRYDMPPHKPRGGDVEDGSFEKLLGKNVIGIVAAVLIFIGIIAFGALIFPMMSDALKVLLIFALSFAISGIGVWLYRRNDDPFSNSVLGCGFGSVFVSVFVTQLYFSMISDNLAYLLLLLWIGLTYKVSQLLRSKTLLYLVHLGCLISLLMTVPALLGHNASYGTLLKTTIYLVISSSLLILLDYLAIQSNLGFSSPLFKLSLCVSMGFCLFWITVVSERYAWLTASPFFPIFLAVKLISWIDALALWLLSHKQPSQTIPGETLLSHALYALTLLCLSITLTESALPNFWQNYAGNVGVTFLLCVALLSYVPLRLLLSNREDGQMTLDSAVLTFCVTMLVSLRVYRPACNDCELAPILSYFFSAFVFWMYYNGRRKCYFYAGCIGLAINYLFTMEEIGAYAHLIPPALLSLLLLTCLTVLSCRKGGSGIAPFFWFFTLDTLLFPSLLELFRPFESHITIAAYIVVGLNVIGYLHLNRMEESGRLSDVAMCLIYILESIVFIVYSVGLVVESWGGRSSNFGLGILAILVLVMGMVSITKLSRSENNTMLGIWYAVKLTWLTLYPMYVLTLSLDERMILSVAGMLVALGCIFFGLRFRIKSMRIYGLILTMLSVLKLVIVDVWSENSIVRVGALIVGGIICFVISAAYNRIEKQQLGFVAETADVQRSADTDSD